MLPHSLTYFELQKDYQRNNSRNNLPKIKDGTYVINLEFKNIITNIYGIQGYCVNVWILLYWIY